MSTPIRPGTDSGATYTPDAAMPPKPEQSSLFEDFIDIFHAPSRVFARRATSGFFMTFLVVSVLSGLFAFTSRSLTLAAAEADFPRIERKMRQNPAVTEEMISQARTNASPGISQYAATPLLILVLAVFVWLFARIVSAKISYGQAAMITSLAMIPRLVQGLARTIEALLVDPASVRGGFYIMHGPSRFMPDDASAMSLALASRFDLFILWTTLLIAIGIAVMGNVPRARGYVAAALVWILGAIPLIATAAFFMA